MFQTDSKKIASGLKKIINGDFKSRVFVGEEAAQKEKRFLTGRQVNIFKVSDTDEFVLDLSEVLKVEKKE